MRPFLACSLLVMATLAVALAPVANATTVVPLSEQRVVELADRVFEGRCLAAKTVAVPGFQAPVTEWTFEVETVTKGKELAARVAAGATELTFRQLGSAEPGTWGIVGMPRYDVGARYRLALNGDSAIGLTSPVGLGQGVRLLEPAAVLAKPTPGEPSR